MNFLRQGFQKLMSKDRRTESTEIIKRATSWVLNNDITTTAA